MKSIYLQVCALFILSCNDHNERAQTQTDVKMKQLNSNKQIVLKFYEKAIGPRRR